MKKKNKYTLFVLLLASNLLFSQEIELNKKWYLNFGAGPSKSLFYSSGGWVRDWGAINFQNNTENKEVWSLSHFCDIELQLSKKISLSLGYSYENYFPTYNISGYTSNGTLYDINTQEADRNTYINLQAKYSIITNKKNKLEIGIGLYNLITKHQEINYYSKYYVDSLPQPTNAIIIKERKNIEGGIPLTIDYTRFINSTYGLGLRIGYNYTISTQSSEHLAFYGYAKIKL